jgi:diguanylate cyclase (GGDEF)-like protein
LGGPPAIAIRGAWRACAAALACSLLLWCRLAAAGTIAPVLWLDEAQPVLESPRVLAWFGPQPPGGIDAAARGALPFQQRAAGRIIPFEPGKALWLKLRLQAPAGNTVAWQVEVPLPVVDRVPVYQQDASGRWFARTAGDTVPQREWSRPGRYPSFTLQLQPGGGPSEVYVEVRHSTALDLPLRLVTADAHQRHTQLEYMALGLAMGALALLLAASLLRAWRLRDALYGWYALHAFMTMLALAAFTGLAGYLFWPNAGAWVDAAPGCLALLAATLAARIVAQLGAVRTRIRWIAGWLRLLGWTGPLFAALYVAVTRGEGVVLLAVYLVAVAALCLCAATLTCRRGDPVGRWLLLAMLPLAGAVVVALARATGWLPSSWLTEYGLVLALSLGVPMLFGALDNRSQERRSVELRRQAAASQDALTGLMKREPFVARLRQAIARHQRRGEGAALAVIELANYSWIQKTRGAEAAEEALLRAVIKLRRLIRDVDTTGRLGEHRFGLILEGASLRRPMNSVASRLVAAGLMEEPGRPKDVVLHFHVTAVVLHEHSGSADELLKALADALAEMSARTQRPVRFLEPGQLLQSVPPVPTAEPSPMTPA